MPFTSVCPRTTSYASPMPIGTDVCQKPTANKPQIDYILDRNFKDFSASPSAAPITNLMGIRPDSLIIKVIQALDTYSFGRTYLAARLPKDSPLQRVLSEITHRARVFHGNKDKSPQDRAENEDFLACGIPLKATTLAAAESDATHFLNAINGATCTPENLANLGEATKRTPVIYSGTSAVHFFRNDFEAYVKAHPETTSWQESPDGGYVAEISKNAFMRLQAQHLKDTTHCVVFSAIQFSEMKKAFDAAPAGSRLQIRTYPSGGIIEKFVTELRPMQRPIGWMLNDSEGWQVSMVILPFVRQYTSAAF